MSLALSGDVGFVKTMDLPKRVKIVEVGPRDGLQNQSGSIPVRHKVGFINRLSDCGFKAIEVGSLVSPKSIPQMVDSEKVYGHINKNHSTDFIMLVVNQKGLLRAIDCRLKNIAVFCAA